MISSLHFRAGRMYQLPLSNLAIFAQAFGRKRATPHGSRAGL